MTVIVGAYAAIPSEATDAQRENVYSELGQRPWNGGYELPFTEPWSDAAVRAAASYLGVRGHAIITLVPGLFRNARNDPSFGPASESEGGRRAAVDFVVEAHKAARKLATIIGADRVVGVAISSSPRRATIQDAYASRAFAKSLSEIVERTCDVKTIVEHCDALISTSSFAKGYLSLDREIDAIRSVGADSRLGIGLNWGRSAIEGKNAENALSHVIAARESGLLASLMFSGCSDRPSVAGAAWADVHMPSRIENPASLLTQTHMMSCLVHVEPGTVVGLKISAPKEARVADRIDLVAREASRLDTALAVSGTAR